MTKSPCIEIVLPPAPSFESQVEALYNDCLSTPYGKRIKECTLRNEFRTWQRMFDEGIISKEQYDWAKGLGFKMLRLANGNGFTMNVYRCVGDSNYKVHEVRYRT